MFVTKKGNKTFNDYFRKMLSFLFVSYFVKHKFLCKYVKLFDDK